MLCPNCSEQLDSTEMSNQKVLHCKNCGGNFFEENGINRVSPKDAISLTKDASNSVVTGTPKVCPKDSIFLHIIDSDEAIPHDVTLFKCPKCHGIFAYPDDLIKFKKAQSIKIEFFRIWGTPLPSLKSVLVTTFIAIMALTVYANLTNKALQTTKASTIIGTVKFSNKGRYVFVNFTTSIPYISSILLNDQIDHTTRIVSLDKQAQTIHFGIISNVELQHGISYQLILNDGNGTVFKTDEKPLEINE